MYVLDPLVRKANNINRVIPCKEDPIYDSRRNTKNNECN